MYSIKVLWSNLNYTPKQARFDKETEVRSEKERLFLKKAYAVYVNEVSQHGSCSDALIYIYRVSQEERT